MSKIKKTFENGKAFIPFITGGDPNIETTEKLIYAMEKAGADLIEIGIPFSDPAAEGPVIQLANERALLAGTTTDDLFDMIKRVREKSNIPLVFLTYYNPVYTYGVKRFLEKCKEVEVDGIIVPDLPYEEKDELAIQCKDCGVDFIPLIAPTSNDRISMIAKESEGFIYCVSSLGVTGIRDDIKTDISTMVNRAKAVSDTPCAIGFGIATPEQAKELSHLADGVIVGSAIVKIIEEKGEQAVDSVFDYVKKMKDSIR
ncbi:MAG TPA: tryptophan synthase subunit alpha [Clostridiales bacterium]|nr:tryptophan synthase subunit alpha [Clostridiales bacterium]